MKKMNPLAVLSLSIAFSITAHASGVGNGAISVVCRGADRAITSAHLLDLLEGEKLDALRYETFDGSWDEFVTHTAGKLVTTDELRGWIRSPYSGFVINQNETHPTLVVREVEGFALPDPKDFTPRFQPKDPSCGFEVAALYDDADQVLRVDQEIFSRLDKLHKAALYTHEILYRYARHNGKAENSNEVRKLVAALYSTKGPSEALIMNVKAGGLVKSCEVFGGREIAKRVRFTEAGQSLSIEVEGSTVSFTNQSQAITEYMIQGKVRGKGGLSSGVNGAMTANQTHVYYDFGESGDVFLDCELSFWHSSR